MSARRFPEEELEALREAKIVGVRSVRTRSADLRRAATEAYAEKYATKGSKQWVDGFREAERERKTLELVPRRGTPLPPVAIYRWLGSPSSRKRSTPGPGSKSSSSKSCRTSISPSPSHCAGLGKRRVHSSASSREETWMMV